MRNLLLMLLFSWTSFVLAADPLTNYDLQSDAYLPLQGTGFSLGGYADAGNENQTSIPNSPGISNASLFVTWEGEGKLRFFSEWDLENSLMAQSGSGLTAKYAYLSLERFYFDYLYSDQLNFRLGKFLTPIGRWNLIHAAPLVWTTNRPLITSDRVFPNNGTGAMAYGTLPLFDTEVDYTLYNDVPNDLRQNPNQIPFSEAEGLHVSIPFTALGSFGFSLASFEQKDNPSVQKNLLGFDYFWSHQGYEISSEWAYRRSKTPLLPDTKGMYVQGVAPIMGHWFAVARYEYFDIGMPGAAMNLWLAGVAYKITPSVIFKGEFSQANHNLVQAPEGFFTSVAILF